MSESLSDKEMHLLDKLCKLYAIGCGLGDWQGTTDEERASRLAKFAEHFQKETGVQLSSSVEDAEYRPSYSVSFQIVCRNI